MKNKLAYFSLGSVVIGSLMVGSSAFAQTSPSHLQGMGRMPGVFGTVTAVSGNTLTINSKPRQRDATAPSSDVTYTVDASGATVTKNGTTSSVANIASGDVIMVKGAVTGTSVVATEIRDGMPQERRMMRQDVASVIQGNGQPVIGGNVTAITGTTLTVTNKSNVVYSVEGASAKIEKGGAVSSLSNIVVGDGVIVQGTVNGTSVVASSVIDQGTPPVKTGTGTSTSTPGTQGGFMEGLFGSVGGFFHRVFGFF